MAENTIVTCDVCQAHIEHMPFHGNENGIRRSHRVMLDTTVPMNLLSDDMKEADICSPKCLRRHLIAVCNKLQRQESGV